MTATFFSCFGLESVNVSNVWGWQLMCMWDKSETDDKH